MTELIDLGRPMSGDVVDLILADHRRFEDLLRRLRVRWSDREAVRHAFSTLHVAHAEAEEKCVYPTLRNKDAISEHEAEHGEQEHAEGHAALLRVLDATSFDSEDFDEHVEELATAVNHHITEEELTILNPAREGVPEEVRLRLGEAFATQRNKQIEADCGRLDNVRAIVGHATEDGLLDED